MNTLRAHGMTTHVLTKYTAGQGQPQGSHDHMTVANITEPQNTPNAKQALTDGQGTNKRLQKRY